MRDAFARTLVELADEGVDLYLLTADLGFRLLDEFRARHPRRFINAGVAEANMISVAAGMAMTGRRVFCYSIAPFAFIRPLEQIRMELCSQQLPVTVVGVGGGLSYGCEGHSHFAIEDLAIARSLPNLNVVAPGDPAEARAAVRAASRSEKATYIRLGRNGDPAVHAGPIDRIDRALPVRNGESAVTVFATGHILARAAVAAEALAKQGLSVRLLSTPTLKPFDRAAVEAEASRARLIVTVEEHSLIGGLGTEVMGILFGLRYQGHFVQIGLPDEYCDTVGTHDYLIKQYGLDSGSLAQRIQAAAQEAGIKR